MDTALQNKIDEAKKAGHVVMSVRIGDTDYIYRSINRFEWRVFQNQLAKAGDKAENLVNLRDESEEKVVKMALLHPMIADFNKAPAGLVSQLADLILKASGFGELEVTPTQL